MQRPIIGYNTVRVKSDLICYNMLNFTACHFHLVVELTAQVP